MSAGHSKRPCAVCEQLFQPRDRSHLVCSEKCRKIRNGPHKTSGSLACTSTTGAATELLIAAGLMLEGWNVFRALSPACFCDLVATKDGVFRFLEARSGVRCKGGSLTYTKGTRRTGATEFAVYVHLERKTYFFPATGADPC